jgi:hypothetical protein
MAIIFVNSGFEKLLVMLSFFLAIIIINNPAPQPSHSARFQEIDAR